LKWVILPINSLPFKLNQDFLRMMKPEKFSLSRRQIIRGMLATSAFAATVKFGTGCTPTPETPPETTTGASPAPSGTTAEPLVVGFIYVGSKDDFGYNQAHAEGAAAIATFALCGFANIAAVASTIGGIGGLAPERMPDLAKMGIRAMIAGTTVNFINACIAGILL
jgi:hypothetical protein